MKNIPSICDIVYINLDHKIDRRLSMESKLNKIFQENEYKRFSALQGDSRSCIISKNELGCFLSHQFLIENAPDSGYRLVLEDDVVFSKKFRSILNNLFKNLENNSIEWDILFLAQMTSIGNIKMNNFLLNLKRKLSGPSQKYCILDAKNFYDSSCSSYIINLKSKNKIIDALKKYARRNYPYAIDISLKREIMQGSINGKFFFPYITGLENMADSSIQPSDRIIGSRLLEDQLNLFFLDTNLNDILEKYANADELIQKNKEAYVYSQLLFHQIATHWAQNNHSKSDVSASSTQNTLMVPPHPS